ncbi:IS3 family transposase [Listeria seeligeri]|nr:IS3 family transposase [Listeria seeligeri]MBC1830228.1 IS3 family transposase [Listeria seeligeri]MBC1844455.1 IS3 family transposase [Listeria seeligeri]MBC2231417.1 IS3 family transposase [Listeria seeligeri]MBF2407557.1 IS3 family transposase [Listeria seeligeri]
MIGFRRIKTDKKRTRIIKKVFFSGKMVMRKNIVLFMKQHAQEFSITQLTRLFGISRSYYYRHRYKEIDTLSDVELRIQELVTKNHFLYGYRKIHALIKKEIPIGINKVAKIMRNRGWNCQAKKKKFRKPGTIYKTFENVIAKNWQAEKPRQKLTTDITYLPFGKSMLYLSTIMDTYNSEIVAYKISNHPNAQLAVDTLNQIKTLPKGAILHSDQGATYTSKEFFQVAKQKNIIRSMSRKGTPSDNAPIESFHSSLKSETFYLHKEPIGSNNIVIDIVENYIYFWNNQRILAKLGYLSPIDYRKKMAY